jgi:hypothetical protein
METTSYLPKAYLAHGQEEANEEIPQRGFLEHRHDEKPRR